MLYDVHNFNEPKYEIHNDKICYKFADVFETKISYGFKTSFAYFNEKDNKKITEASLHSNIKIKINCA